MEGDTYTQWGRQIKKTDSTKWTGKWKYFLKIKLSFQSTRLCFVVSDSSNGFIPRCYDIPVKQVRIGFQNISWYKQKEVFV